MKRVTILAVGSRGDVQPFVALALGLRAAGIESAIAAAADYAPLVAERGIAFQPLVGRISELLDPALVEQFLDGAANPLRALRSFLGQVNPIIDQLMRDCRAACRGADAIIASTLGCYPGAHLAEAQGIPLIAAHLHPFGPTGAHPQMFFPDLPRSVPGRRGYNRASHALAEHVQWQLLRRAFNRARRTLLGLKPLTPPQTWRMAARPPALTLYGYSAAVAPPPADWRGRDAVTGYWFLDRPDWTPPRELAAFLDAGPPPIFIGFGSMMLGRSGAAVTSSIAAALERTGQRGILARGWGDLGAGPLPPWLLAADAPPHDWLFRHVRAVVHHGGAGVTAAALRAGAPAIVVPFLGDQRFWARRVLDLGAGPPPIPRADLSAARLAAAIEDLDPAMAERAAQVGQILAAEDGVARAVERVASS